MSMPITSEMYGVDGRRFCPTEEQLVNDYLKPKILGNEVSQIQELDAFSMEPWTLPEHLKITPNDLERYVFCPPCLNAGRPKRTSELGYWKATGKARKITAQLTNEEIGRRKIYVFYKGRFPNGLNTKYVMHEFSAAIVPPNGQSAFVLCKIMKRADKKTTVPTSDDGEATIATPESVANDEAAEEGFRKVDPDRYESANEGFSRGQKHLWKTISREKHGHVHVNQAHQVQSSSVAAWVEVGKFGLEEEVERLEQDNNVLMQELVRLSQQQQATDHQLQTVGQCVQVMEQRQQQMMSFFAKAMHSPGFLNQLVQQQNENNRRIAGGSKKRRLAGEEEENSVGRDGTEGQIVKFHSSMNEEAETVMHQMWKMNSSPRLEPSISNSTPLLIGNARSSGTIDSNSSSSWISSLMLSEVPAAGDSSFLPVESGFPANHVPAAISEVQPPPYWVTDQVKTNYSTEKNMHNPGQVTPVLNSSEMEGILPESAVAISNATFVGDETGDAEYIHSITPALDVTITKETGVFSPDQDVDILVDAIPRLPSINEAFWEQFLAAGPLNGDTDEIHPSAQESSIGKESEWISWEENGRNKVQQMNYLTEQMGLGEGNWCF